MPRNYRNSRWQPEQDAKEHLKRKYPDKVLTCDRVAEVTIAADYGPAPRAHWYASVPGAGHITAALTLVDSVRRSIDAEELHLIAHALARGVTWPEIAAALGYDQPASAVQRYARLRGDYPGYRPPYQAAAQWAAAHEAELRAAVIAVVAHREAVTAEGLMQGTMVRLDDLAALAEPGTGADPAVLFWAAHAATHAEFIWGQPTPAGRAVAALQDLVTEPAREKASRPRARRARTAGQ